jgi:hypothetical protein
MRCRSISGVRLKLRGQSLWPDRLALRCRSIIEHAVLLVSENEDLSTFSEVAFQEDGFRVSQPDCRLSLTFRFLGHSLRVMGAGGGSGRPPTGLSAMDALVVYLVSSSSFRQRTVGAGNWRTRLDSCAPSTVGSCEPPREMGYPRRAEARSFRIAPKSREALNSGGRFFGTSKLSVGASCEVHLRGLFCSVRPVSSPGPLARPALP